MCTFVLRLFYITALYEPFSTTLMTIFMGSFGEKHRLTRKLSNLRVYSWGCTSLNFFKAVFVFEAIKNGFHMEPGCITEEGGLVLM